MRRLEGGAFLATTAVVTGDVSLAENSSVWFGCVLRADDAPIYVGTRTNIQELCMIHPSPGRPTMIGEDVTLGHQAMVHGVEIGDRSMIAIGATILANSSVGTESIVAAGAVVLEGFTVPDRTLVAGVPARVIREVTDDEVMGIVANGEACLDQVSLYL